MQEKLVKVKNGVYEHLLFDQVDEDYKNEPSTLLDMFLRRLKKNNNSELFGVIKNDSVKYITTEDFYRKFKKIASFLFTETKEKELIGIYAVNCLEWAIVEYAGYLVNCTNVPLYSTFQPSALEYVLKETEMKILFASSQKANNLYETVLKRDNDLNSQNISSLEKIVLFDRDENVRKLYEEINIKVMFFDDLLEKNYDEDSEDIELDRRPKGSDTATICYTSGTSGTPKGVVLKHSAFCIHICGYKIVSAANLFPPSESVTYLSYLPLAHVFERICFTVVMSTGGRIVFFRGNPKMLQMDYEIAQPDFIAAVPRVLNLFEERINETVSNLNFIKKFLFKVCLWWKRKCVRKGNVKSWLVDKLVFNKVSKKFGGNLKYCLTGGASINPNTVEFLQSTLCMKIFQGYGMTEGLAANIVQPISDIAMDNVGISFTSCKLRLKPVESFPYENYGELLMSGKSLTSGYFKQPEKTEELWEEIDGEKWLKTGDVFKFENDRFYCVGRVKEMFKTSYGEYIVPEHVENCFVGGCIEDIYITGTRDSDSLCAVVVSSKKEWQEEDKMLKYIRDKGMQLAQIRKITKYEIPKAVYVINTPFMELENGELITPSMKKRRGKLYDYFKEEIESRLKK